ncbi:MAG: protein kinase [Deltaproteobacteria bacterium]|nr:protein kinase [Deltaproteobacteria bacterium]
MQSRRSLALTATIHAPATSPSDGLSMPRPTAPLGTTSILPRLQVTEGVPRFEPPSGPRYVPVEALGAGGMGEVALVEDRDIGRKVARKRLLPGAGDDDVLRFVDEVRVVGKLDHPSIVPIHDVGVDEHGEFFFVMKFVEGETLEAVIERLHAGDPATLAVWDITRRLEVFRQLLFALSYAHERGTLHRDLKPANVMIGAHGEVMLMDWGVARPIGGAREAHLVKQATTTPGDAKLARTSAGTLVGTPIYMSPEQAAGETDGLDARSDLYSACLVLHELVSGGAHLHEDATSLDALLARILTFEAPSAWSLVSTYGIPAELAHFLHRGLQRSPEARWPSAAAMANELHAILDGRPRVQCPMTLTKRVMRGISRLLDRRPWLGFSAVVLFALSYLALLGLAVKTALVG